VSDVEGEVRTADAGAGMEEAGLVRRVLATVVDFVVVPVVSFGLLLVTGLMEGPEAYVDGQPVIRGLVLGAGGYLLLNGWLLAARGQTLGKALTGLVIVSADGDAAPLWRLVCIRGPFFALLYLPMLYAVVGLLALLPLIDQAFVLRRDRRALHDLAAGTRVVRRPTA
jgi:uncharacterized RDD family membrane protein YckC